MNHRDHREHGENSLNTLSETVIGCAMKVHRALGPGLLESAYEACLSYELAQAGLQVEQQKAVPIIYQSVKIDCGYRVDLIVENQLLVELKAIDHILPIHEAQVITYLKLANLSLGLLLNFNCKLLKQGIKRIRL